MLGDDDEFFKSNFHNVGLVNPVVFPKTVNMIHENYKICTSITINPKAKVCINTNANKGGSRISSKLKTRLENQPNHDEDKSTDITYNRSMPNASSSKLDPYSSQMSSPMQSVFANTPASNEYQTPKKSFVNRKPIKASHNDISTPLFREEIHLPSNYAKPPLGKYPGHYSEGKHVYYTEHFSPTNHRRGTKNDPFLQRLNDYREIYEIFKDKYDAYNTSKGKRPLPKEHFPLKNELLHEENIRAERNPNIFSDHYSSPNTAQRKLRQAKQREFSSLEQTPPLYIRKQKRNNETSPRRNEISSAGTNQRLESESSESHFEGLPSILKEKSRIGRPIQHSISPKKTKNFMNEEIKGIVKEIIDLDLKLKKTKASRKNLNESALDLLTQESPIDLDGGEKRSRSALRPSRKKIQLNPKQSHEDYYKQFAKKASKLISKCATGLSDADFEIVVQELIEEIKKYHPVLSKFSHVALKEILRGCSIVNIKNQSVYKEKEHNEYAYIIIYGEVYLKSKTLGVFKQCTIGDTIGEEAVIEDLYTKLETAQVIEETALLEVNITFLNHLRDVLSAGFRSDYILLLGILRKNLSQKKVIRQRIANAR